MRFRHPLCAAALLMACSTAPAVGQFTANACPAANVRFAAVAATHKSPPYPVLSQRMGEEGTTLLRVSIDPRTGAVADVAVERSSGSLRLDDAAAIFVKENWQWTVSRFDCASGFVITLVSIQWALQEQNRQTWGAVFAMEDKDFPADALQKKEHGTTLTALFVDENGKVEGASVLSTSGFADLDAKAAEIAKARSWKPAQLDGHAVKTTVLVATQWPERK